MNRRLVGCMLRQLPAVSRVCFAIPRRGHPVPDGIICTFW
jgi:hypothetical protein